MYRTRLIPSASDPSACSFSRCGRTDKGVSGLRQVISVRVRSLLSPKDQQDPANDVRELDYLHILNQLLPADIRMYEVALRPPVGFDARFSCLYRHYKYFFDARGLAMSSTGDAGGDTSGGDHRDGSSRINDEGHLDLDAMQKGASYFVGEHDFRNFCKVDASKQISNFKRKVLSCSITRVESDQAPSPPAGAGARAGTGAGAAWATRYTSTSSIADNGGPQLYCLDLKGSAFLWHQVRSMMAVLLLIGQGYEQPKVISELLNVTGGTGGTGGAGAGAPATTTANGEVVSPVTSQKGFTRRPVYEMADDIPLVLFDCVYPADLEWKSFKSQASVDRLQSSVFGLAHDYWMKYTMVSAMADMVGKSVNPPHAQVLQNDPSGSSDSSGSSRRHKRQRQHQHQHQQLSPRVRLNLGDGIGKNQHKYTSLAARNTLDPPELVNERWRIRKLKGK